MHWGSAENFLAMGGYGFYVWSSYGVTALLLAAEVWQLVSRRRSALRHGTGDRSRDRSL